MFGVVRSAGSVALYRFTYAIDADRFSASMVREMDSVQYFVTST